MSLENLWAGWRRDYVSRAAVEERDNPPEGDDEAHCVFCRIIATGSPSPDNGIVWRDEVTLALLNAYPYASGHLLVMPVRHVSEIENLTPAESAGMWQTTVAALAAISGAYDPDGLNMGANLGRAAGAGIPRHVHLHALPRWSGDTNFMTSVAGVRVMPESLPETWRRLHDAWPG